MLDRGHSVTSLRSSNRPWRIFLLTLCVFAWIQCKRGDHIDSELIYGKWNIVRAERNGRETPYLRGGYFIVGRDGWLVVNITGSDEKGKFTLEDQIIRMDGDRDFVLQTVKADSLIMRYRANPQSEFLFYMLRDETQKQ